MAKPQILQCVIFCLGVALQAQSFPKAKMLYAHGLTPEAQKELIDLVFSSAPALAKEKPKAMDLLATIAFDKNNANLAYTTWNKLISDYPNSPEAKTAKERLPLLKNLMGKFEEENLDN